MVRVFTPLLVLAAAAAAWPAAAQLIPSDAAPACTVSIPEFNTWWVGGSPSLDGAVKFADSVSFPGGSNCDFHKWSEQMYLWMTSPGPDGRIRLFSSPAFFQVSPLSGGTRTFIQNSPSSLAVMSVRAPLAGPRGHSMVFDTSGRLLEVERAQTAAPGALRVRDRQGGLVAVAHARVGARGRAILLDQGGREIDLARPEPVRPPAQPLEVQQVVVDGVAIFVTPLLVVADVEQGEADTNVLMSRNGSLVYYAISANDMFAYYLTGAANGALTFPQFPTTPAQRNQIVNYAAGVGVTIPDANALAIEVKSSWVEASALPDPGNFIRMTATVPDYDRTNPKDWVLIGTRSVELAMVGLHIAGSVKGHPEMIWATWEHDRNAPNDTYSYVNNLGSLVSVPSATTGYWLFSAGGATAFNEAHMSLLSSGNVDGKLDSSGTFTWDVSPSDTIRRKAWGSASDVPGNETLNTEVISLNNSVLNKMPAGDVRALYRFIGSTWLGGGAIAGNVKLANTTMETYVQGGDTKQAGALGCLECHAIPSTAAGDVSHIFGNTNKLF